MTSMNAHPDLSSTTIVVDRENLFVALSKRFVTLEKSCEKYTYYRQVRVKTCFFTWEISLKPCMIFEVDNSSLISIWEMKECLLVAMFRAINLDLLVTVIYLKIGAYFALFLLT